MPYIQVKTERTGETGTDWDTSDNAKLMIFSETFAYGTAVHVIIDTIDWLRAWLKAIKLKL